MTSIRSRLVVGLLLGLMLLLALSGSLLYFYVKTVLARQFDDALRAEARAICSLIKMQRNGKVEIDLPQEMIPQLVATVRPQYFQVWREDETVLIRSPALGAGDLPYSSAAEMPVFADMELPQQHPGKALLVRFAPAAEDEEAGDGNDRKEPRTSAAGRTITVAVAQDLTELHRVMTVLFSALLAVAATLALGTAAVVSIVVRRGLQPLQQLACEAANIDAQRLTFRFSLDGLPSELQPICLRLNDSLERLQQAFQRQRRFTADAAHELRTPIAELRSLADVALKWDGDRDTSLGYFNDAREIAQQMEAIVTTLLSLARCQSGAATGKRESVDMIELVHKAWDGYRQTAVERRLAVSFELPERVLLETDRTMLYSMVNNLLANAAQYTRIGGTVTCKAEANGSAVHVSVSNDTDCLSPDDLPHLLEAFWRKDTARTDGLHCGLGLTLVDSYATALGGQVKVSLPNPELLCVSLALPRAVQ